MTNIRKILISEQEKSNILDKHKNINFKKILQEAYSTNKDVLDENGRYTLQGNVSFINGKNLIKPSDPENGKYIAVSETNGVVWGDDKSNSIVLWNQVFYPTKVKELLRIPCDSQKIYSVTSNSNYKTKEYEYTASEPQDFINKMKSLFCCGTKLKPNKLRPGSVAYAKKGDEGYTCKDVASNCPSGTQPCGGRYNDCSSKTLETDMFTMCDKCSEIGRLQACLKTKKIDNIWGCETETKIQSLGYNGKTGLSKSDIDKICGVNQNVITPTENTPDSTNVDQTDPTNISN
jgi:hypothetical protein